MGIVTATILTACGGGGAGTPATTTPPTNSIPVSNSGSNQSVAIPALITLDGSGSTDANGDALTYTWSLVSKPAGSAASLNQPSTVKPSFIADVEGVYSASLVVNDGKSNSTPSTVTVTARKASLSELPPAKLAVETSSFLDWTVKTTVSPVTGVTSVLLNASANEGLFVIQCDSTGAFTYTVQTTSITANGGIKIRVGLNPVISEPWSESSSDGFKRLYPPNPNVNLLKLLSKNWDLVYQYDAFSSGVKVAVSPISGLSSAIDKTRAICKWSTVDLPPQNGFGKSPSIIVPADAQEGVAATGHTGKPIRLIAWREINAFGNLQLVARIGDPTNDPNTSVGDKQFFVTQNGKTVSAVSGLDFTSKASEPTVISLNGDYDASRPLILTLVVRPRYATDVLVPITSVSFN